MSDNVPADEFKILGLIGEQATAISDISSQTKTQSQEVSKICRRLETKGLVSTKSGMVQWTARGQEWWSSVARKREKMEPEAASFLTELEKREAEFVNV